MTPFYKRSSIDENNFYAFSKCSRPIGISRKALFLSQHFEFPGFFWQSSQPHTGSRGGWVPLGGQGGGLGIFSQQQGLQGS